MKGEADGQGTKPVFSCFAPERKGKTHSAIRDHPCGAFGAFKQWDNRDIYTKAERMVCYGITEDSDTCREPERPELSRSGRGKQTKQDQEGIKDGAGGTLEGEDYGGCFKADSGRA